MSWTCPHCGIVATLQAADMGHGKENIMIRTAPDNEMMLIRWMVVRCPSKACGKFTFDVWANFADAHRLTSGNRTGDVQVDQARPVGIGHARFEPRVGLPLSTYVPKTVKEDYEEACLIKDLSPKAAATLCRRALQGMVRDFWQISKSTLAEELNAIQAQCDPQLFSAMMGLKGVGNIGAHPERDINLIIDVEEGEVDTLLELLRILDKEWYVARANRTGSLAAVIALGSAKAAAKNPASAAASPVPQVSP